MNKQIFIFGDFNLDLMKIQAKQNDSKIREFLELMLCQGLLPSCLIPTRIDDIGATLIDNIFSNSICFSTFVILNDISDHGVIISEFNLARSKKNKRTEKTGRIINDESIARLIIKLGDIDWKEVVSTEDANKALEMFYKSFNDVYNDICPKVKRKTPKSMPQKPWISPRLLKCINEKNRLYKIKCNYPSDENIQKFKLYKNTLTRTLRESERNYYEKEISSAASQQKMWEILRDKLNKNKRRSIPTFLNNGNDVNESTEKKDIAEFFAKHFRKIGEELVRDLLDKPSDYTRFMPQNEDKSLYMLPVSFDEYQKAISDLKRGNSASVDDISTNLLKKISGVIYEPLADVINKSIKNGVFP